MPLSYGDHFHRPNRKEVNTDNALIANLNVIIYNKFHKTNKYLTFDEFMKLLVDFNFLKEKAFKEFPRLAKRYNISEKSGYTTRQINSYFHDIIPHHLGSSRRFISVCLWTLIILKDFNQKYAEPILPENKIESIKNLQQIVQNSQFYLHLIKNAEIMEKHASTIDNISSFYIDYVLKRHNEVHLYYYSIVDRFYSLLSQKIPGKKTKTLFMCLTCIFFPKKISHFFDQTLYSVMIDYHIYKNEVKVITEEKSFNLDFSSVFEEEEIVKNDEYFNYTLDFSTIPEEKEVINIIDSFLYIDEPSPKRIKI